MPYHRYELKIDSASVVGVFDLSITWIVLSSFTIDWLTFFL